MSQSVQNNVFQFKVLKARNTIKHKYFYLQLTYHSNNICVDTCNNVMMYLYCIQLSRDKEVEKAIIIEYFFLSKYALYAFSHCRNWKRSTRSL